jgi:hypothetical protein
VDQFDRSIYRITTHELLAGMLFFPVRGELQRDALKDLTIMSNQAFDVCH